MTCRQPPACSSGGSVISLQGSCAADGNASVVYVVGGRDVLTAACPDLGQHLSVSVRPFFPSQPACSYDATLAYTLASEFDRGGLSAAFVGPHGACRAADTFHPCAPHHATAPPGPAPSPAPTLPSPSPAPASACPPAPLVSCGSPPACPNADAEVALDGVCSATGADVVYSVGGAQVAQVACPQPGVPLSVAVRPVLTSRRECAYNDSAVVTVTSERPSLLTGPCPQNNGMGPGQIHARLCVHVSLPHSTLQATASRPWRDALSARWCRAACAPARLSSSLAHADPTWRAPSSPTVSTPWGGSAAAVAFRVLRACTHTMAATSFTLHSG